LLLEEVRRRVPYDAFWKEWIKTARAKAGGMASPKPIEDEPEIVKDGMEKTAQVLKYDSFEGLLYGVVLEPDSVDAQDDVICKEEIQKTAHGWMAQSQLYDLQHESVVQKSDARVVESYVAPQDIVYEHEGMTVTVKAGSWVVVTKLLDDDLKKLAQAGEIGFYSVRGFGNRKEMGNGN